MLLIKAIELFKRNLEYKQSSDETIIRYMKEMGYFNDYLSNELNGMVYLETITLNHLQDYLEEKINRGLQPSSINQIIYVFRSFYNFLVKKDYVLKNLAVKLEKLKTPTKEREYLTKKEFDQLLKAIDHAIVNVIAITIFNSGLRVSEIISLKLEDVNLKEKTIKVLSGKGDKDRTVPMNDNLVEVLRVYLENTRPMVSTNNFFATKHSGTISRAHINTILKNASKEANLNKKVTSHILRHSFASYLLKKDVNLVNIQKLLGHSSLKTTAVYAHTNMKQLEKAVDVFA